MTEPRVETQRATDGYALHVLVWPAEGVTRGRVVVLHGVQSHGGWYHGLGRTLAQGGYEAHFPDRRGSGSNAHDRGHTPSARRLIDDVAERLRTFRASADGLPTALAGISWGGKTAVVTAARHPDLVDLLALICPGLQPRVGVSLRERLAIAIAFATNRRKTFPIPLSDPALFTASPEGQRFIASDPLGLHEGTAGLLAASTFIDARVRRAPGRVTQPVLLMLAGRDRIVNNARTLAYFDRLASRDKTVIEYPEGHHTLEFEPDPTRYARDLVAWLDAHQAGAPNPARPAGVRTGGGAGRDEP
jgi:alpha-beta hydrolase superfamily lysophospholipase